MKGLVEALQVTAPRPSAADHMSLFPVRPIDYPSQAALAALTAQWAAAGIWALAILGNATLYEAETEGLTQVHAKPGICTMVLHQMCLTLGVTNHWCAMTQTCDHAPRCMCKCTVFSLIFNCYFTHLLLCVKCVCICVSLAHVVCHPAKQNASQLC